MRVAIYARVSTQGKKQENENQLRELRAFAERLGYTLYKEYLDEESGGTADRPQFQQLFLDAHQRRFDVVLGRAAVPAATVSRIKELRAEGKSVRTITSELKAPGVTIGKSAVGKYC